MRPAGGKLAVKFPHVTPIHIILYGCKISATKKCVAVQASWQTTEFMSSEVSFYLKKIVDKLSRKMQLVDISFTFHLVTHKFQWIFF